MQISKLSVLLTATAAGFSAVMKQGEKDLGGFTSAFEHSAGMIAGAGALLGAGEAVSGIIELTKSTFENIVATGRMADSLGMSTEALSRLEHAAKMSGVSNDSLTNGIYKMNKALGGADEEGGKSAEAFERLHLKVDDLIKLPVEQRIDKIADALNQASESNHRAADAQAIFGKGALALMPVLKQGSEGLKQMAEDSDALGTTISGTDVEKVEQAHHALAHVGEAIQGGINQVVIQMAPFIEIAAEKLEEMATAGGSLKDKVLGAFESVVQGIAGATDYLALLESAFHTMESGAQWALYGVTKAIEVVLKGLEWLAEKLGKEHSGWGDAYAESAEKLKDSARDAFRQAGEDFDKFADGTNAEKARKWIEQLRKSTDASALAAVALKNKQRDLVEQMDNGAKEAGKFLDDLQKKIDQYNMSNAQKAADEVKRKGGGPEQQAQAKAMQEHLDQLEAAKKSQDELAKSAEQAWDETRTPLEKYNQEIQKLLKLADQDLIDPDTFTRAAGKAKEELDKATAKDQAKEEKAEAPGAMTAGSADAARFAAQIQAQQDGDRDPQRMLVRGQEKGNNILGEIRDNTKGGGSLAIASFN